MLSHLCILEDPQHTLQGAPSELIPSKGKQNQKWLPHPCFLGAPKMGQMCYVTPTYSRIPNAQGDEQNQKWLPHSCLLGGPKQGRNAMSPYILRDAECEAQGPKSEVVPHKGEQNLK